MSEIQYTIQKDELIIFDERRVADYTTEHTMHTDDLMLTDRNIVWTRRSMYGYVKDMSIYALHDIKSRDGRPLAEVFTSQEGYICLRITFAERYVIFHFKSAPEYTAKKWVNAINYLLSDLPLPYSNIPLDLGYVDIKEEEKEKIDKKLIRRPRVTVKCLGCRAPITGFTGEEIKCRYCDVVQIISDGGEHGVY